MLKPTFHVHFDPVRGLVEAELTGFWNLELCRAYISAVVDAQHQATIANRERRLLIDSRCHGVQSQDVVDELRQFASGALGQGWRTAVVIDGALHKMQASRITATDVHRVFTDMEAARSWVLS